ncbi:pancreatic triacylglycerol lipase isoform X1 [Tribolium madens]|uniref:pancreatic triacylglycerol lipase isoform X1 n=1 Tax=Tribolium madens TaxID=41895 RepID=UPI001CF75785|nr:pancreatic triacylglycerol lipase isoform X1 [Tribolium madens]
MVANNTSVFLQTLIFVMNQSNFQQDTSYNYYFLEIGKNFSANNASKCYGIYGCFQLSPPWTSENRPVSLFPEDLNKIEPRYPLYTRKNPSKPTYIDLNEFDVIASTGINPRNPVYVISHGYMEGGGIYWIVDMAQELLKIHDCSVIVVDWQGGSSPPYTQAVANIRLVGAMTAHLLHDLWKHIPDMNLDHVHCIGHSLGAHLCGYVGYTLQRDFKLTLGRITGLDPAEPHFAKAKPPVRLDRTAAKYVDVVHTDASQFIRGGLGMTEKIGHVDYYPNGGTNQPGCGKSIAKYINEANGSFFLGVRKYMGCNHMRSYEFFIESINPNRGCSFLTVGCNNYEDFLTGKCFDCGRRNQKCIQFGYHSHKEYKELIKRRLIAPESNMVQFLITGETKPYCRGHYRITVKISNSGESIQHGGEVGQLFFTMHETTDGKGPKSHTVPLNKGGYHEPGKIYTAVVPTSEIKKIKAVEVEWRYQSSYLNPLTWRLLAVPKIYIEKITIDALEIRQSLTVCPKDGQPLHTSQSHFMIPSYC